MRPIRKFSIYQCRDGFYIRIVECNTDGDIVGHAKEFACSRVHGIYKLIKEITGLK